MGLSTVSGEKLVAILCTHGWEVEFRSVAHVMLRRRSMRVAVPLQPLIKQELLAVILRFTELERELRPKDERD
jgi:predicted RNA binding protein YcfA (HicA-like mRNA interferase family)